MSTQKMQNIEQGLQNLGEKYGGGLLRYDLIPIQGYHLDCYSYEGSGAGISVISKRSQIIVYSTYRSKVIAPSIFIGEDRVDDALRDIKNFLEDIKHPKHVAKK